MHQEAKSSPEGMLNPSLAPDREAEHQEEDHDEEGAREPAGAEIERVEEAARRGRGRAHAIHSLTGAAASWSGWQTTSTRAGPSAATARRSAPSSAAGSSTRQAGTP